MKKTVFFLLTLIALVSCSKDEGNLTVTGKVQGLKKGTLYLQKIEDTSFVTLDSVVISGENTFTLNGNIEYPQVLHLHLDKTGNSVYEDRILFFAEPGEMVINTTLNNFEVDAVVEGSRNQQKLMEYRKMMQRFNDKNLELIQDHLEAQRENDSERIGAATEEHDRLLRRRYLYTVNFALNNRDLELAPYLAISEIHDANIKYLDTIYKALNPGIKESPYGKALESYIQERRGETEEQSGNIEQE